MAESWQQIHRTANGRARGHGAAPADDRDAQRQLDMAIGMRLRVLRTRAGMSLGDLAARSEVSKAMIARIERAESSPTAHVIGKLCSGLGVTVSQLVVLGDRPPERMSRFADQPTWRDAETGYRRRHVSPAGAASGVEIISVELPAGAHVRYQPWGVPAYTQQLLMLEGSIILTVGETPYRLARGDCLDFDVIRAVSFQNPESRPACYLLFIRNRLVETAAERRPFGP